MDLIERGFMPGPVLLLGAPGVGKGTQAQILVQSWGIPQISTGDLIRDNITRSTSLGVRFRELVASGVFVPDEIVNEMVENRLAQPDVKHGYILDGYPRTLGQAEWLDNYLSTSADLVTLPVVAVSIEVGYDRLLRRVTGRRTGSTSNKIYNIYTNPPLQDGVCDVDGEPLVQRPDDTEEVFVERLRAFHQLTAPVIEHYRGLGRFQAIDGEQAVAQVTESIVTALKRLRRGVV